MNADGTAVMGGRSGGEKALLIVLGLIGVVAGLLAITSPGLAAVALTWILGIWLIVRGIFELVGAFSASAAGARGLLILGAGRRLPARHPLRRQPGQERGRDRGLPRHPRHRLGRRDVRRSRSWSASRRTPRPRRSERPRGRSADAGRPRVPRLDFRCGRSADPTTGSDVVPPCLSTSTRLHPQRPAQRRDRRARRPRQDHPRGRHAAPGRRVLRAPGRGRRRPGDGLR